MAGYGEKLHLFEIGMGGQRNAAKRIEKKEITAFSPRGIQLSTAQ
jgi:hypothetical protein